MSAPLAVVGGGRMGEALTAGLLGAGWNGLVLAERLPARRDDLLARFAGAGVTVVDELPDCDGAVIAVKPGDVEAACRAIAGAGARRVVSIAAGVTIARLREWLSTGDEAPAPAVLRAMPNTPALVGAAASALSPAPDAGAGDVEWARSILAAVGTVEVVAEPLLDAVTGLSGSGPAYVFLLAEALVDAGVLAGLPRPVAERLTVQTIAGAGRLLAESGEGAAELRAAVTSPGGTTAAGLQALESRALRAAVLEAVTAATARSRELGAG
ncbi:MAG: pyrroline-5-carboxylate reductase [Acidimicrobiales bacterium]